MNGKRNLPWIALLLAALCVLSAGCGVQNELPAPEESVTESEAAPEPVVKDGCVTVVDKNGRSEFRLLVDGRFYQSPVYFTFLKTLKEKYGADLVPDTSGDPYGSAPFELIIGDKGDSETYTELRQSLVNKQRFGIRVKQRENGGVTVAVAYKSFETGCTAIQYLMDHYLTDDGFVLPLDTDVNEGITIKRDLTPVTVPGELVLDVTVPDHKQFGNVQGGLFDGTLYYQAFAGTVNGREDAVIAVFDTDGNLIRESEPLGIWHANSLSDMGDGTILISEYHKDEEGNYTWSLLDKETLTILDRGSLPFFALSFDYSTDRANYVCLHYDDIAIFLDQDMNEFMRTTYRFSPDTASQNFRQTENGIYAVRYAWNDGGFANYLYEYDVNLIFRQAYTFDFGGNCEIQSVSEADGEIYAFFGDHSDSHLKVYRLTMPENP